MYDYYIEVSTCECTFFMHIGAVILKCSQTGEILVSKIRDLYREDMQPFIDLTKGAELLYEVQFVSFQGYYYICIAFTLYTLLYFCRCDFKIGTKSKVIRGI